MEPQVDQIRAALVQWSATFEATAGRPPTDQDKQASEQYQKLARRLKELTRGAHGGSCADGGRRRRDGRRRSKDILQAGSLMV